MSGFQLRALNPDGMREYYDFLLKVHHKDSQTKRPVEILNDANYSQEIAGVPESTLITVPDKPFRTKIAMVEHLHSVLGPLPEQTSFQNDGLWSWLSLLFFESLCERDEASGDRVQRRTDYVLYTEEGEPDPDYYLLNGEHPLAVSLPAGVERNFRYRHMVYMPYRLYTYHDKKTDFLNTVLDRPTHTHGERMEQLASRFARWTNPNLLEAVDHCLLTDDPQQQGFLSNNPNQPGSLRRLQVVFRQRDRVSDTYGMPFETLRGEIPDDCYWNWKDRAAR